MRSILTLLFAVALTTLADSADAQDVSDPGCAAIEQWVSPLGTARGRIGAAALARQNELIEQIFADAATEPVFGLAYSRWQLPHYESAAAITERCLGEVRNRNDQAMTIKLGQANGRIQDRLRHNQAAGRMQNTPRPTNAPKVNRPDCETLQTWASVLMTEGQRRAAAMEGKNQVEITAQRQAQLLSDAEISPRFGYPLAEWTYNDYMYASTPITQCAGKARAAGDRDAYFQLRSAYSIIRRLGNELR